MKKEQLRKRGCAAKVTLSDGESCGAGFFLSPFIKS
jgi:hypothetical protein